MAEIGGECDGEEIVAAAGGGFLCLCRCLVLALVLLGWRGRRELSIVYTVRECVYVHECINLYMYRRRSNYASF